MSDTSIARVQWPDNRQRYSSASMIGDFKEVPERFNLGYYDWTIEFWMQAAGPQPNPVTKPFTFEGSRLELNIDAPDGGARLELQDAAGNPIPGFALADSMRLAQDNTAGIATWKSGTNLASLAGRPVRLKVELTNARLFAFQFR